MCTHESIIRNLAIYTDLPLFDKHHLSQRYERKKWTKEKNPSKKEKNFDLYSLSNKNGWSRITNG